MAEYISRETAIDHICELIKARRSWLSDARGEIQGLNAAMCGIGDIPAADVAPVVRGRWVLDCGGVKCTACGEYPEKKEQCYTPFCCLCGADMREVQDGLQDD